ncbi:MAG TPA: 50S ribosomal protein L10 [Thermodesulfobacteriota bacterium]|nr:50S ribosomal protein L10 [Thermodesulfobacteriota bacterium]
MLTKDAKQELVREYGEKFKDNPFFFVVEYKGLTVKEMELLRRRLKKANADFGVVKNTILKIASAGTDAEKIKDLFEGPTAIAISKADAVSVAKVFTESAKELPILKLKGGVLEGKVIGVEDVSKLSKLPPKDVLLGQFMGLISSPISNFMGVLAELQRSLIYALGAVKEMKEKEEGK